MGCRQVVRHSTLTAVFAGSNPATPATVLIGPLNNAQINEPFDAFTAEGKSAAQSTAIRRPSGIWGKYAIIWHISSVGRAGAC